MPLAAMPVPFDHPDWIFELKYDGWRALAYVATTSAPEPPVALDASHLPP
jgi:hypothetical protein